MFPKQNQKNRGQHCLDQHQIRTGPHNLQRLLAANSNPELFSHSTYVQFFVTFATKVPYLTFCDKMRQFLIQEIDREGGNKEKMRKCRE